MGYDLPAEWLILDKELKEGVPTSGWPGDPRLDLHVGQVIASRSGHDTNVKRWVRRGEVVARRLEVWRACEDGKDRMIGKWNPDELPTIIADLVRMDPSRPRHVSVLDSIDSNNAAIEDKNQRAYMDVAGEMGEHLAKLNHDINEPLNVFRGIPGTRDRKDLKR